MSKSDLGSLALQAPSTAPRVVLVTPNTCHDLTLFKGLLKEYRKLDDSINMRMNRTSAQFRDRDRAGTTKKGENLDDQACLYVWKELTDNWKRREDLINYCVNIMDQPTPPTSSGGSPGADATQRRLAEAESYSAEVKKSQIKRELTVEGIIRRRSWEAFHTRCQYFVPPVPKGDSKN